MSKPIVGVVVPASGKPSPGGEHGDRADQRLRVPDPLRAKYVGKETSDAGAALLELLYASERDADPVVREQARKEARELLVMVADRFSIDCTARSTKRGAPPYVPRGMSQKLPTAPRPSRRPRDPRDP